MNDHYLPLSDNIISQGEKLFGETFFKKAKKFLTLSKVCLSFVKESEGKYFIVSGIVKDDQSFECKIVYKHRLEGTDAGPLTSHCSCIYWNDKTHCPHTAAIFIFYFLHHLDLKISSDSHANAVIPTGHWTGVSPEQYGSIIVSPSKLIGAGPSATYPSLQYVLSNNKVANFPVPANFAGKIIIQFALQELFTGIDSEVVSIPQLSFAHAANDGETITEISLFENIYLFNWRDGMAFHLPSEVKDVIQKIRFLGQDIEAGRLIQLTTSPGFGDYFELVIQGIPLSSAQPVKITPQVTLAPSERNNNLDISIYFTDDNDKIYPPPLIFKVLTFSGGDLGSFKKKKNAYEFLLNLYESLANNNDAYKKNLFTSSKKNEWPIFVQYALEAPRHLEFDFKTTAYLECEHDLILGLLKALIANFGDQFFRFSSYLPENNELRYSVPTSTLFQGLMKFQTDTSVYGIPLFYNRQEIAKWSSRIRFERRSSTTKWFDLTMEISKEDLEIIQNLNPESGLVMSGDNLIMLTPDQLEIAKVIKKYMAQNTQREELNEGELSKFIIPFNRARIFELFELKKMGIDGALTPEDNEICEKLLALKEMPQYPLPEGLKGTLRPYQITGYNWLRFLHEYRLGACLADDMGLGKTLQTIAFLQSIYTKINKVIIICPVTILINWQKEFEKFSNIESMIYHGGERKIPENIKIIITSYGVMKKEADTTFRGHQFDIMILDEVQHLKNIRSLGAWAARKIEADFRICLTGTPVENDLAEFYNILDLAIPGVWGDLQFVRAASTEATRKFARKTAGPFILRRSKSQVLTDLPPKIENNVYLTMSDEEKFRYAQTLIDIKNRISGATSRKKYGEILRGLLKLRQNCLWQGPEKIDGKVVKNHKQIQSTKINFLIEQLEQIIEEGHQVIVFSQFTTYLDIIQGFVAEKHWKFSRIDGSQTLRTRQTQVDEFQAGKTNVFLISLKAGGVGLNLTAASYVFIMDPWWNPAVEAQAVDRAHRIGQKNTLTVYRPIIKDSVEEKVLELQESKKQLFQDLLPDDDEKLFSGRLTMDDFEQLFI